MRGEEQDRTGQDRTGPDRRGRDRTRHGIGHVTRHGTGEGTTPTLGNNKERTQDNLVRGSANHAILTFVTGVHQLMPP